MRTGLPSAIIGAAICAVFWPPAEGPAAPRLSAPVVLVAETVPTPRLNPTRQPPHDIGSVATDDEEAREAAASEDSELPATEDPEAFADVPIPVISPESDGTLDSAGLKVALTLLANGDPAAATIAAYALPNRVDIKIVDWLVATSGNRGVSSAHISEVKKRLGDWPGQALLRLRYELALIREKPSASELVEALGGTQPASDSATTRLTEAYLELGRESDATKLIGEFWRTSNLSSSAEKEILADFSGLLTDADHKARMDRLLYEERSADALRAAALLDEDQQALAKAVAAVIKRDSKALKALDDLPSSIKNDPIVIYSRVQALRRADKIKEAAALLAEAPRDPKVIVDPDAWWIERRLLSREMIDEDNPKLAYEIAAGHAAESSALRAEAEFHAGWYALEFLHDSATATKHFAAIAAISTRPLSSSRAEYWLGRAAAAAGDTEGAADRFLRAAAYPTTFYGQLASARLGHEDLGVALPPQPDDAARERFFGRELVQVIQHLTAAGQTGQIGLFYRHLADTLTDPAEIALLADLAERNSEHQLALQIGLLASVRGLPVEALAFPTAAIPNSTESLNVERPLVFAVARQESRFNPQAVSGAGARGLLQLMPATAKETAKSIGVAYSRDRLTTDPAYNATLGAAYLGNLVSNFGGSYVMSVAAYNAGASRVADWVKRYGDPRDPNVDVVDWIELIPFTETRNYVQRVIENLQVYRARLDSPALLIEADMKRGARR